MVSKLKLRSDSVKSKNYCKQLALPFKICADFEDALERIHSNDTNNNASHTKKYQENIPCSFAYKVVCIVIDLASQLFFREEKIQSIKLSKQFLKKMSIAKK